MSPSSFLEYHQSYSSKSHFIVFLKEVFCCFSTQSSFQWLNLFFQDLWNLTDLFHKSSCNRGFNKSTDHRPTDHRSLTHRPTGWPNTDPPTHWPTDPPTQISPTQKTRFYFKDSIIKKYSFYRK